jgi:hypothetical protein
LHLNSEINMMITYQSNSDIISREYGFIYRRSEPLSAPIIPDTNLKRSLVVMLLSNPHNELNPVRERRLKVRCSLCLVEVQLRDRTCRS